MWYANVSPVIRHTFTIQMQSVTVYLLEMYCLTKLTAMLFDEKGQHRTSNVFNHKQLVWDPCVRSLNFMYTYNLWCGVYTEFRKETAKYARTVCLKCSVLHSAYE